MCDLNQLGKNIRSLRNAYGETLEQLGEAIHAAKNTVSNYETGKRKLGRETIIAISRHYMISVEELMNSDLTSIPKPAFDKDAFWKNIDIIFPIVSSEKAQKNYHFKKAYDAHMAFYSKLHAVNLAAFDEIDESLTDYFDAVEDEDVRVEAAANLLSILYLLFSIDRSKSYIRENKPAAVMMAAKKDEKVKRAVQEMDFSFDSDTDALSDDSDEKEIKDEMAEWLLAVKKSGEWSNLADYYLALRYVLNLVDNDLDWGYNQRIGIEMMYSFLSVKNKYAARFIKLNNKVLSK